jgi:enoyl-CoA hydratase
MLLQEINERVATLTLNRPDKHNALSQSLRDDLVNRLKEIEGNNDVDVAIITGAGPSFCAGFDLAEFQGGDTEQTFSHAIEYHREVYTFSKPLIAAVNGRALAGGMDLAAMCDLRIVSSEAVFGQPQVKMGIDVAFDLMKTVLPEAIARDICLTGRIMTGEESVAYGFANETTDPDALMKRCSEIAMIISESGHSMKKKAEFKTLQPDLFKT